MRVGNPLWWCTLALTAFLAGCRSDGDPKPRPANWRASVTLRLRVGPGLNPNDLGEATPLDLRVYQLTERKAFTAATFESLWTKDQQALGAAWVKAPQVITLSPRKAGSPASAHEITLDPRARFLGLMGLFAAERKEGLEERKLCVSLDEAALREFAIGKASIRVAPSQPQ